MLKVISETLVASGPDPGEDCDPERWIEGAVGWVHDAGRPYIDWLLDGDEAARSATERWLARPSSEIYIGRATILADGDGQIGGFIALPGSALEACRSSDAVAALGQTADRAGLLERMRAAAQLFSEVTPDRFYLSRLGVTPERRGKGHGGRLVREYIAAGERAGYRRFRLDVSADNEPAIKLYRSLGFEIVSEGSAPGGRISYVAMDRSEDASSAG